MKLIILACLVNLVTIAYTQKYWDSQSVQISFFSTTPVEDIEAHAQNATMLLDTETNEVATRIKINSFKFHKELMQEHFNENYLESEKFPYGSFSGKINEKIDWNKPGAYAVTVTGKLTIHGKTQERTIAGNLKIEAGKITIHSKFEVLLVDHQITVPKIVFHKIAERINVSLSATVTPRHDNKK